MSQSQEKQPDAVENTVSELDDFLDSIGLEVRPLSPEDALMTYVAGGNGYKKIHNYRYWLRHELLGYFDLIESGVTLMKDTIDPVTKATIKKPLTQVDYVLIRTKYFLRMNYQPWFDSNQSGIGIANIDMTAQMFIEHEDIRGIVHAPKKDDIPRNI